MSLKGDRPSRRVRVAMGLTPSFLVGALRTPPGAVLDRESSLAELRALLESMRDESVGSLVVRIAECPKLQQPVAALVSGAPGSLGEPIVGSDGSPSCLYAWPQYLAKGSRDVESLAAALGVRSGRPFARGTSPIDRAPSSRSAQTTWRSFNALSSATTTPDNRMKRRG